MVKNKNKTTQTQKKKKKKRETWVDGAMEKDLSFPVASGHQLGLTVSLLCTLFF